jgi:hypothetical protein
MKKISKDDVDTAVISAEKALTEDGDLGWISSSCLVERAYFLGLLKGLAAISEDGAISDSLVMKVFRKTYWTRSADNTFGRTNLGSAYRALQTFNRRSDDEHADLRIVVSKLTDQVRGANREWERAISNASKLLQKLEEIGNAPFKSGSELDESLDVGRDEICALVSALEPWISLLSLIETNHEISWRLEK